MASAMACTVLQSMEVEPPPQCSAVTDDLVSSTTLFCANSAHHVTLCMQSARLYEAVHVRYSVRQYANETNMSQRVLPQALWP
jgi:hypothetical protein